MYKKATKWEMLRDCGCDIDYDEDGYEDESMFNPCPNCGGELEVRYGDMVYCKECGEYIGWYIASAGAIRLDEKWYTPVDTGE